MKILLMLMAVHLLMPMGVQAKETIGHAPTFTYPDDTTIYVNADTNYNLATSILCSDVEDYPEGKFAKVKDDGGFKNDTPGTYAVTFSAKDSDGNQSEVTLNYVVIESLGEIIDAKPLGTSKTITHSLKDVSTNQEVRAQLMQMEEVNTKYSVTYLDKKKKEHTIVVDAAVKKHEGTDSNYQITVEYTPLYASVEKEEALFTNSKYLKFEPITYTFVYQDETAPLKGWVEKADDGWYYYQENGELFKGWKASGKHWYFLDWKTGKMATGWIASGSKWYYCDENGAMAVNEEKEIEGKVYTFDAGGAWVR